MELWIRSTVRVNLTKCDCLSVLDGSEIYDKDKWEHEGYTICQCYGNNPTKSITPLGTYKTKERALEVLDEIQEKICLLQTIDLAKGNDIALVGFKKAIGEEKLKGLCFPYEMPKE